MDPERWPDAVREFVDKIVECGRCSTKRADGVMVTVEYQNPVWGVRAACLRCNGIWIWQFLGPPPRPGTKPDTIPLPDWVKSLQPG